jgi:hypothetical protein
MDVVYHQNGIARRMRRGNERVVRSRRRGDGFAAAMIAEGLSLGGGCSLTC